MKKSKFLKAIFVVAIALFGINVVNAQVSVDHSNFELSTGNSQIVTFSGASIENVFLDYAQSSNADYVGVEALNTERLFGVFRLRITCLYVPETVVYVSLAFMVRYFTPDGFWEEQLVFVNIVLINIDAPRIQGDTGHQPLMMYATKPE